jgi:ribosome biogenesis GTPase / thiamine phosphate phosphatase
LHQELLALGWTEGTTHHPGAGLQPARVVAVHRGLVAVRGADLQPQLAPVAGALLHAGTPPVVGDWVGVEPGGAVREVLPRAGVLRRTDGAAIEVLAAHVDLGLVVTSANGDLNPRRLERFLALVRDGGIPACIVLTKCDLIEDPQERAAELRADLGAPVLSVSARTGVGIGDLAARLPQRATSALIGSSGVGKSTLVNALLGEERQVTKEIRENDAKGRHATTHRELFTLPGGALLLDTPGVRLAAPAGEEGLDETFADVGALAAACRFADCAHDREPGCAVQAAIEDGTLAFGRWASYKKLQRELAHLERRLDKRLQSEERKRWAKAGAIGRANMRAKGRR